EVLDFPGVISWGNDLAAVRRSLASALVDMAEVNLSRGESLPLPNALLTDPEADLEEPIYLIFSASTHVQIVPTSIAP
ncbi:hypothetical protein, partial [Microcystis sp. M18BS1]